MLRPFPNARQDKSSSSMYEMGQKHFYAAFRVSSSLCLSLHSSISHRSLSLFSFSVTHSLCYFIVQV